MASEQKDPNEMVGSAPPSGSDFFLPKRGAKALDAAHIQIADQPDPSPHSQVERRWTLFSRMVGAPGPMQEPVVDVRRDGPIPARFEEVEVMPVSDHEAREAELEKERDEARGQTEAMAWAAGWETDGCPPFEFEAVKAQILERGHEDSRDYQDALDRAKTATRLLADVRAELERRAELAEQEEGRVYHHSRHLENIAAAVDAKPDMLGYGGVLREVADYLLSLHAALATPCSDQGGDRDV
jgi:hypothetical protein